ncbi:polymorphic toxin-type HINT domain-containing protein [Streptomyces sp. NPDC013455]|uniref:polymorphic toxin-type HINT domain-containing protein n=1 Tax=Streptomyces sp. NPDC013455 TaxID=3155605 RepID=UPI0033E381F1
MNGRSSMRFAKLRRRLALASATVMMGTLLQGVTQPALAADNGKGRPGLPSSERPVATTTGKVKPRTLMKGPRTPKAAPDAAWPEAATTVLHIPSADAKSPRASVRVKGLPLTLDAQGAARKKPFRGGIEARLLSHKTAQKAGIDGLLFTLKTKSRAKAGQAGRVQAHLDYSGFADAYGGSYASRLTMVELPACALTTPDKAACRSIKPVAAVNDAEKQTLTAQNVSLKAGSATVLAAVSGSQSAQSDYKATSLSPSATWNTSLNTGEFTWSYDMPAPQVPGGLAPKVGLSYSSGSVDGRTANTNNQASWAGDGFELWSGYIERRYKPCSDDGVKHADGSKPADLCWGYDNAFITFNGKGGELVPSGKDSWKLKNDDGTKIDHLTSSDRSNGDDDNEYWRLTTPDGTKYYFGYNRLPGWADGKETTDSTWTVPVFGDDTDEPCHAATFADSYCQQAWRWNLDYAVDAHGNAIAYYYDKETNSYGRDLEAKDNTRYVRGGTVDRIEYGLKSSSVYGTKPLAKVDFTSSERCLPDDHTTCSDVSTDAFYWYDTPWDLNCDSDEDCDEGRFAPVFFTRKRLTEVTTRVWNGTSYHDVDSWKMTHRWGMSDTDYQLLLDSVQHTGRSADPAITLPKTTFAYTQLANRLDKTGDGYPPFVKERLSTVADEFGGQIDVNYSAPACAWDALPTPETNTTRCFPQYIGGSSTDDPERKWFNKYVVTSVTATDRTGGAPDQVTSYDYLDGAAWHYDDDDGLTKEKSKTWSQWRGYGHVRVRTGGQGDASAVKSQQDSYFLRGMDGDRKDTSGGTKTVTVTLDDGQGDPITDEAPSAGFMYRTVTYSGPSGKVLAKTVSRPWHHETAKKVRDWGTVTANFIGTSSSKTWTSLDNGAGTSWRTTSTATTYDTVAGRATQVDDFGDSSTRDDNTCTRTTYATNATANILTRPARVETVAKSCSDTVSRPDDVISDVRTAYDGAAYDAAPTKGDATNTAVLKQYEGTTAVYLESGTTYDEYGRQRTSTDLTADVKVNAAGTLTRTTRSDGRTTTTAPEPTTGFATKVSITTPPAKTGDTTTAQTTSVTYDVLRNLPKTQTDTNGKVTNFAYDALGRSTKVWLADRLTGQTPSYEFTYTTSDSKPVAIATRTLGNSGEQLTSYALYDGFLRPRQTQDPGPNGGSLLADTFYDERGQVAKQFATYYTVKPPTTVLAKPEDALDVETQNRYTYDGLGRQTEATQIAGNGDGGTVLSTTRTVYNGDRTTVIPPQGGTATTTLIDARGHTTALRQLHARNIDAAYDTTTYDYTPRGELKMVTDPAGNKWTYTYDLLGRQIKTTDPDKGTTLSTYDDRGQLITTDDARPDTPDDDRPDTPSLWYGYDNLGRKTEVREKSSTGTLRAKWVYDTVTNAKGQLAEATRYDGGNAYTSKVVAYDNLYRPLRTSTTIPAAEKELAGTYLSTTSYKTSGLTAGIGYPKAGALPGATVAYTYDDTTLRPTVLDGSQGIKATTGYSFTGKPLKYELSTNDGKKTQVNNTYEWGTQRLATSRVDRENIAGVDRSNTYHYDETGNVRSVSDVSRDGTDTQCFTYDYLRRLTEAWAQNTTTCATTPSGSVLGGPAPYWQSYTYDLVGNRRTETLHDLTGDSTKDTQRAYAYPDPGKALPHALTSVTTTGPASTVQDSYTYDETGNTTTRTLNGDGQNLTWDPEGHLAKVTAAGKTTEYLYDADGNRLIARSPIGTTLYLGATEITLPKGSTTPRATRYFDLSGGNQAVQQNDGTISFTLADHHGTAQLAIAADTQKLTQRRTLPFGGIRGTKPTAWPGTKGFVGGTDDTQDTGLTHLGAREYDPVTGRFISVDPLMAPADPQSLNAYGYANNNPATLSDPTGLCHPDQCGIGVPRGNVVGGDSGIITKAPQGAGGVGAPRSSGAGYRGPLPAAANGDSNNMVKVHDEWHVKIYPGVYFPADNPHLEQVARRFNHRVAYECGDDYDCMVGDGLAQFKRVKAKMFSCDSDWDCGKDWFNPLDLMAAGADAGLVGGNGQLGRVAGRGARRGGSNEGGPCSFDPDTLVLLADGTSKPIDEVKPGDQVESGDPESGKHKGSRKVTAAFVNHDDDLIDVQVLDVHGKPRTLRTTSLHPFWDDTTHTWVQAGKLKPGHMLNTASDKPVRITAVKVRVGSADMHNLTVSDLHTYYVLAGETPVLVHNSNGNCGVTDLAAKIDVENLSMTKTVENHTWDIAGTRDVDAPNFGKAARPYMNGNNGQLLRGIMEGSAPRMDSRGAPGVVEWRTPGAMNGSNGIWELNIDANSNRIVHFLFKSTKG